MSGDIREWREQAPTSKLQVTDPGLVVRRRTESAIEQGYDQSRRPLSARPAT